MPMTKAEMQVCQTQYHDHLAAAQLALKEKRYRDTVDSAVASWPYIDGMMQYERKYEEQTFRSVESIDIVARYAPLLLDRKSVDSLEALVKDQRRIDKHTTNDLRQLISTARSVLGDAYRLWTCLETFSGARQDELRQMLQGDQERWRYIAESWEEMGVLVRRSEGRSYLLYLATVMSDLTHAKCRVCGSVAKERKRRFLQRSICMQCGSHTDFVILGTPESITL